MSPNRIPLALIALSLVACGESPAAPTSSDYACTPDPARLAQRIECVEDDACPCGAHCDLGLCVADCSDDLECESGACDAFGRCRDDGELALVPPPPAQRGRLEVAGDPVDLIGDHLDGAITLTARGAAIAGLRIVADPPLALHCPTESGTECTIPALAPEDGPIAIRIGLAAPVTDLAEGDVRIFSGGDVRVVHVRMRPSAGLATLPLEGVFGGRARITALGLSSRTATLPPGEGLAGLEVPISLEIHPESGGRRRVTMRDELGIVFPNGAVVGELLRGSDGSYRMEHSAQRWVGGAGTLEADVVASAQSTTVVRGRSGLSLVLRTRFDGVVAPATSPFVDWEITATRQHDLAADATPPALPTPVAARDPLARATTPFPVEAAFQTGLAAALATATTNTERIETVACSRLGAADATRLADALPDGSWSGDLPCADGEVRTLALQEGTTFDIAQDVALCFGDLDAASGALAGTSAPTGTHDCVDGARLVAAIAMATDADRRRALGEAVPNDLAASTLGHRYLQEWLHANAFVARQGAQIDVLNDVLDGVTTVDRPFLPTELLGLENEGWELLLHPRLAIALLNIAPRALHAPDYRPLVRPGITIVPDPREDQGVGLPVAIDRAAAVVLDVHRALLERARYVAADREATEASAQRFARSSFVLHLVGAWMHELVRLNVTEAPAWETDAEIAEQRYGAALGGILRQLVEVRRGANPLGIDDEIDLPLYRVGDETSALGRFSALTDFLLGTPGLAGSGIAEMRVVRAETALATAQDAWARSLERDFATAQLASESAARIEGIQRRYGDDVFSLCGLSLDGSSIEILAGADAIDPESCYVRPACRPSDEERVARMGPGDAAFAICIAALARDELGEGASGPVLANGFDRAAIEPVITGARTVRALETSATGLRLVLDDGSRVAIDRRIVVPGAGDVPAGMLDADTLGDIQQRCSAVRHSAEAARPDTTPESCAVHADCPSGLLCTEATCTPDVVIADTASCYTGALGELVASIRAAATDVEIARSELAELGELYDRQMQTCILQDLGSDLQLAAMESHNDTMRMYGGIKLAADIAANVAGAVKDCATTAASDNKFGIAAGVACGAAGVEAAALSVSDGMEFAMDEAERAHELAIARIASATDAAVCANEAEMTLVGTRTATLRITRASQELAQLMLQFENGKGEVGSLLFEGELALRLEQERTLTPMEIDFWLGSSIEAYSDAFRAARRGVYLAAIALEYEYQASLPARGEVLSATRVSDLRRVVEDLRDQSLPGTIGASPSELTAVVSLRTELLRLADRTGAPEGEHQLDDVQRFRALLSSPRHAAYDETGRWIGQRIPFRIVPAPALGVADADGIAIYAGADCAERLWSVRAALVGDGVITGSDTTRTRLEVRKRNTFFSQWCTPRADRGPFQIAATRPSRNLFLDPFSDFATEMLPPGSDEARAEADAFASARLMPLVGVTRGELESEGYADGGSIELAGRGLYGDYEIFLPAEMLAVRGAAGVDLAALDDVLLRLDYLSVASR